MRDPEVSLGRIARTGFGLSRRAGAVHWFLYYEGPQRVFMDPDGQVFAMPVGLRCEERMCGEHPDWLVGTYSARGKRRDHLGEILRAMLIADLRARADELACERAVA
jgi:hypothetical protein